ncbi:uncharacterized protein LOC18028450 [Eutrema salsugineum]|nr:uncharacterized protein LOC18028450 [Eutrema salsugineum]
MSRANSSAADAEITDSTMLSPPLKKAKTDQKAEKEVLPPLRTFRKVDWEDPEYWRQRDMFLEECEKNDFYDLDLDKYDYCFAPAKFEWGLKFDPELSKDELMKLLIKAAIDAENEDNGTNLEFVKYVCANVRGAQGFCFYITLWARDLSSSDPEPKLYWTLVRKFRGEFHVVEFKLRPTQYDVLLTDD